MRTWAELRRAWTKAHITDAEFITQAEQIGWGYWARNLVKEDLETP